MKTIYFCPLAPLLYLLLALIFASSHMHGQDAKATRAIRMQLFYWHVSNSAFILTEDNYNQEREKRFLDPIQLWYLENDQIERIQVRPGQRSSLITVNANEEIVFYRIDPTGLETLPESQILRISVDVAVQQGLLIISGSNPNLQADLIDVSNSQIPKGAIRVANYSARNISAKVGEEIVSITLNESALVRLNNNDSNSSLKLMIAELEPEKDWKVFYSTVLSVGAQKRILIMVYPSAENNENLKVKILNIPS